MAAVQLRATCAPLSAAELDGLVKLAALTCQVQMAMLTFPDQGGDWCGALLGMADGENAWQGALSAAVTTAQERIQVADASTNERLRHCALVAGPPFIKCFAGVPIALAGGEMVGVLAVADTLPKPLDASQLEALELLARHIAASIEQRRGQRELADRLARELVEIDGLRESQRTLQTLIGNLPGVAYRCRSDLSWRLELVSEGCLQLTGYTADDLIEGRVKMVDIIHPGDLPTLRHGVAKALKRRQPYQSSYRIQTPNGQAKWVWDKGCGIYSADGQVLALEGFITDISELKCAEERIRTMAYFDELTGLPNRLSMLEALSTAIARSGDSHAPLALLHVEVDNFREINETLGYREGDRLLQALAARLQERGEPLETLARIAESSFALLLPGQDASHATQVARDVAQTLHAPLALGELLVHSECSIGITLFPGHGNDPDALLRRANVARYGAKQGTERVAIYAGSLDSDNAQRLALMTDLRRAIDRDELLLLFQPKLRMGSKRVSGVEALVRWEHPERGMISPNQFITFAESAGLITKLTYWVLAAAVRESHLWHDAGRAVPIAINLSPHDIRDPQLNEQIARALQTWGGAPDWIQFELTESCIMEDLAAARQVLTRLREAGFKIFIDDFGTGYSSLSYLRKLPVDYIKIDQSFVSGLGSDKESAAIVKTIIELAHSLGIEVVAEGVESTEAMDMLSGWGCEEAQGYCISKPISGRDFQAWSRAFA
ncbi:sensor domain-containing phosphodiesterase [Pseudomonas aeruginosa]|uniref:sensor domain-containing phosphodiesterase n=1 Tax=Pseudomonas aeruginosa TaxID=287 RepID=UPI00137553FE|nr:EAL domain-containing protein [Pseudomonas aeruginosa]